MLLRFHCKNSRSFRDLQQISLVALRSRSEETDRRLIETGIKDTSGLRCAAIYGPNGSGKSNLLRAIADFSLIISVSQKRWDESDGVPTWDPFFLDDTSPSNETEFEASVVIENLEYRYGFCFNKTTFTKEWLYESTNKERALYRRKTIDGRVEIEFPGRNLTGNTLETIRQVTRPNSLFLSAAAQNNHERLKAIHKWFVDRFNLISGHDCTQILPFTADQCRKSKTKESVKMLIAFADVGIADFEVIDEDASEDFKRMYAAMVRAAKEASPEAAEKMVERDSFLHSEVRMLHRGVGGKLYPLTTRQESRGTLAYFSILGPLLDELKGGSILLVDELEASMHPLLVRQLVGIFNDPDLNPKGAQIIFATHNTSILDPLIVRRDQVWLAEKDQEGASIIHPLSDFKPRKDQDLEAGYLHGRFGAIPFLDRDLLSAALGGDLSEREPEQSARVEK
jgi:AAA15 family ATPase/GTPase